MTVINNISLKHALKKVIIRPIKTNENDMVRFLFLGFGNKVVLWLGNSTILITALAK